MGLLAPAELNLEEQRMDIGPFLLTNFFKIFEPHLMIFKSEGCEKAKL